MESQTTPQPPAATTVFYTAGPFSNDSCLMEEKSASCFKHNLAVRGGEEDKKLTVQALCCHLLEQSYYCHKYLSSPESPNEPQKAGLSNI